MSDLLSGLKSVLNPVRGSGIMTEETRPLESLHRVVLEISGDLVIQPGDQEQIVLRGEDNILPLIETPIKDGQLKIRYRLNTSISTHRHVQMVLTVKELDGVETHSSGDIFIANLASPTLRLAAKGSGRIETRKLSVDQLSTVQTSSGVIEIEGVQARDLQAEISGSGNLRIQEGTVHTLELRTSSAGGLHAPALRAEHEAAGRVKIEISGSGSSVIGGINAAELNARLTSSGDLTVHHLTTAQVAAKISGSGDVKILNGSAMCQTLDLSSSGKYLAGDLAAGASPAAENKIRVSGSGGAFPGELLADRIHLELVSGGSLMARKLTCDTLQASLKGSGNVSIEDGSARSLHVQLTSGGHFNFRQLQPGGAMAETAQIRSSGSGNVRLGSLKAKQVELVTESSGDIRMETLEADGLKADLKGSGSVHIRQGSVRTASLSLVSAGGFLAQDLQTETTSARLSGSGDVKISVSDRLDAVINSSGGVTYRGKPIVSYTKDGSGEIKRAKS